MTVKLLLATRLALQDWWHDRAMTVCAVLALAPMLAVLLVLLGVQNGVVQYKRGELLRDPQALIITPMLGNVGESKFSARFFEEMRSLPGVCFIVARMRDVVADFCLVPPGGGERTIRVEPTGPGDPWLARYGAIRSPEDGPSPGIVLSAGMAAAFRAGVGDILRLMLDRKTSQGQVQSTSLDLHVAGVLPPEADNGPKAFVPLQLLLDVQDYRDSIEVFTPTRRWHGRVRSGERTYTSFRLHACDLDAVGQLADFLRERGIKPWTNNGKIAEIRKLDKDIGLIIQVVAWVMLLGVLSFMLFFSLGTVQRKRKILGVLLLLGFSRFSLRLYPLVQLLMTAVSAVFIAWVLYILGSYCIDNVFIHETDVPVCVLPPMYICSVALCVFAITLFICIMSQIISSCFGFNDSTVEQTTAVREV